ncbi:hypothetical protein MMC30_005663 [Trapelia coarctata]|nr:hypothetical protein [Trapelia coarctata]
MFTSALKSFSSNITANYTVSSNPSATAGAWKVFDGKKKSTGKVVSIFVFDRKSLESPGGGLRSRSNGASLRKIHDEVVERLKKEASSLARLRHPNILELAEPVEDTRSGGLMFATEPITATLAGLLRDQDDHDRLDSDRGRAGRYRVEDENGNQKEAELDELEIQKGLLQVAKGLEFLHESAGLVHGNLTPEGIYINQKSDWKISGLGFSGPPDSSTAPSRTFPIALSELLYHDPRLPRNVQLDIDYSSPDFVMDGNVSVSADMFSLGLVMLALYNNPHESPIRTNGNISTYKKLFSSSSTVPSASNNFLCAKPLPRQLLTDVLPRLITRRPAQRMNAREFQQSAFFDNIMVSAIRFLDSLPTKTPHEKSQFMRGLPRILEQFPKSVLDRKVLPALLEETKDRELLALILANVFKIIQLLPSAQRAFADKVLPQLREIFFSAGTKSASTERDTLKEAALVVVLENMALIAANCAGKNFKDDILPIIQLGLESQTHTIVDKALTCLPTMLSVLDFSTVKNDLFPIVAAVFSKTSSLGIKVRALEAFVILCGGKPSGATKEIKTPSSSILDKYTVQEKVVPLLKAIKTKEPAVMMAALHVFQQVGKIADTDFLAVEVLPILWSFSLGPLLNLQQFQEYMTLIKNLSSGIEQEQTKKLSELASNSTNGFESPRSNDLMSMPSNDPFGSLGVGEDDFERLVLGKSMGSAPQSQRTQTANPISPTWPTSATSAMSSVLRPQQAPASRAITPDQIMSNFATLKPSSPTNSGMGTHSQPSWSGMQPMQPTNVMSNPWGSPPASSANNPNAWTVSQPPNVANILGNLSFPQNTVRPAQQQSSFSIQPPPSGQQTAKKTGLDAYESLI